MSEYLSIEYEQKTREQWTQSIFRQVIPTANFALLPDEEDQEIGLTHVNLAKIKRKAGQAEKEELKESGGTANSLINPKYAPKLKVQAVGIQEQMIELSPIIFEEVYAIEKDKNDQFVEMVKNSQELCE